MAADETRFEVDGEGVRRLNEGRLLEEARWNDLVRVSILTTSEGPFCEDLFYLLRTADGRGCAVPQGVACEIDLLPWLQKLPGFRNEAMILACGSTGEAEFVCWERPRP